MIELKSKIIGKVLMGKKFILGNIVDNRLLFFFGLKDRHCRKILSMTIGYDSYPKLGWIGNRKDIPELSITIN